MRQNIGQRHTGTFIAALAAGWLVAGCSASTPRADLGSPLPQPVSRAPAPVAPLATPIWTTPPAPLPTAVPYTAPPRLAENRFRQTALTATGVIVVHGDTLYGIARRHKVSIAALMSANRLQSAALSPGQTLIIPR